MNRSRTTGILCVLLSACIFGFTPVLAGLSYQGGNNGVNMAFLRGVIPLPFLFVLGRVTAPRFRATRRQTAIALLAGVLQFGCSLLLYSSYSYLSVGIATILHFLYPLFVILYHVIADKMRPGRMKWAGLILGMLGAVVLVDIGPGGLSPMGMALAVLSGVVFAGYMVVLSKEAAEPMPLYRLMTLCTLSGSVLSAVCGIAMGKLTLSLTPQAWGYVVVATLLVSLGGCTLLQAGVRLAGDTDSSIYSLLEPLSSLIFGMLLLGETLTLKKGISSAMILGGLLLTALADKKKAE